MPAAATPDKPGKIYVGNLDKSIDKDKLQGSFSKYGEISEGEFHTIVSDITFTSICM